MKEKKNHLQQYDKPSIQPSPMVPGTMINRVLVPVNFTGKGHIVKRSDLEMNRVQYGRNISPGPGL